MARSYCWGQHLHNSWNIDKSSQCLYIASRLLTRSVPGMEQDSAHYQRKVNTNLGTNPLILNGDLPAWHIGDTKFVDVTNHSLIGFKAPFMRWNPCLTLLRWQEFENRDATDLGKKTKYNCSDKAPWLLYIDINVLLSLHQRSFPLQRWELTQRPQLDNVQRTRDLQVLSHKWDVFIKSYLSGLRELSRRGIGKIVKVRDDENQVFSRHKRSSVHLNSERQKQHTQGLRRPQPEASPGLRWGSGHKLQPNQDAISN